MIKKYISVPSEVMAIFVTVDNLEKAAHFCAGSVRGIKLDPIDRIIQWHNHLHDYELEAKVGEYIVKGNIEGDCYPCNKDVFESKYKQVELAQDKGLTIMHTDLERYLCDQTIGA